MKRDVNISARQAVKEKVHVLEAALMDAFSEVDIDSDIFICFEEEEESVLRRSLGGFEVNIDEVNENVELDSVECSLSYLPQVVFISEDQILTVVGPYAPSRKKTFLHKCKVCWKKYKTDVYYQKHKTFCEKCSITRRNRIIIYI